MVVFYGAKTLIDLHNHREDLFFWNLLDLLEEGIVIIDKSEKIFAVNLWITKILDLDREILLGRDVREVFSFDKIPEDYQEKLISLPYPREKGTYLTVRAFPLSISGHQVYKVLIFRDVTLFKDLESKVSQLKTRKIDIITHNETMLDIVDFCLHVAESDATVLIQGETGTGKELIANLIHYNSRRKNKPFIKINCAAFPETLLESELFGYVKGAFTGAYTDRAGRFEIANGGTLFLDEIGELSYHLQAKLLRVLQSKSFEKLGSNKTVYVDVRLIAATNRDLREEVKRGNFREDLYYRISVVPIHLPPLRERKEDIPLLIHHFLKEFEKKGYKRIKAITPEAMRCLINYDWPGNVRELENAIEYALVCTKGEVITPCSLPPHIRDSNTSQKTQTHNRITEEFTVTKESPKNKDRKPYRRVTLEECLEVIKACGNNKALAARMLNIDKSTLYRKLKKLDKKFRVHNSTDFNL
ncbi:MAG: sigma 54-interacting transcriptional regulator [Candidatus Kryptonium sp.]